MDYSEAEELRKSGHYEKARDAFQLLWAQTGDSRYGWRYAYCLRKTGKVEEAIRLLQEIASQKPEDTYVRGELAWALYEGKLVNERVPRVEHASELGERILGLTASDLLRKLVVFRVIDRAKGDGRWEVVTQWCDRLSPGTLDPAGREVDGRQAMSDRERWYFARVRAAYELEKWREARTLAIEASQGFPRNPHFKRWAALAWAELGHVREAVAELEGLVRRGRPDWYIHYDLAVVEAKADRAEAAFKHACRAALAPGEDKAKVNLYALMARLWLLQGEAALAAKSAALARRVREREGWKVPAELQRLESDSHKACEEQGQRRTDLPADPRALVQELKHAWERGAGLLEDRETGVIVALREDRGFGFIRPDDGAPEDIYFDVKDAPANCKIVGQRVSFVKQPHFDHKKRRESARATQIRPA